MGCKAYLGIDKFNVGSHAFMMEGDAEKKTYHELVTNITKQDNIKEIFPAVTMRSEMLDALKLIKADSSVVIFNGIEYELFTLMQPEKRQEYFTDVANEIRRVIGGDGYIISNDPFMLTGWGGLKLKQDPEFHKTCNPHSLMGQPEMYKIVD